MMTLDTHRPRLPEARLRPSGAGAHARAVRDDAQQWVTERAMRAGRFAGRVLPPLLAITMITGVIIALGFSVGQHERTRSYDFQYDYDQILLQQEIMQQQMDQYLRNSEYMRQLQLYQQPTSPYPYDYTTAAPSMYDPLAVPETAPPAAPASRE